MLTMPKGGFRPGAGRKPKNPDAPLNQSSLVSTMLGDELLARLDAIRGDVPRAEIARQAVQEFVERREQERAAAQWVERQESGQEGVEG